MSIAPDDIDAWIDSGDRPESTFPICLAGSVYAEWEAKAAEIVKADEERKTLADGKLIRRLVGELEEIRGRVEAQSRLFRFHALEPYAYRQMVAAHPPRDDDDVDKAHGVNVDSFYPALVAACTVSPEMTPDRWERLRSKLSARQWDEVWGRVHRLNRGEVDVPKSFSVSELTRRSDET